MTGGPSRCTNNHCRFIICVVLSTPPPPPHPCRPGLHYTPSCSRCTPPAAISNCFNPNPIPTPMLSQAVAYKESGTFVIRGTDEINQLLDDQIVKTQTMMGSPYIKPNIDECSRWEKLLVTVQQVLEEWLMMQRTWLYLGGFGLAAERVRKCWDCLLCRHHYQPTAIAVLLGITTTHIIHRPCARVRPSSSSSSAEPIFSSEDIMRQMPQEGRRFASVDKLFRSTMQVGDPSGIGIEVHLPLLLAYRDLFLDDTSPDQLLFFP